MKTINILKVIEYVIENEAAHYAETVEDSPQAAKNHIYAIALQARDELTYKKPVKAKAKAPDLPENWQGSGRYKLLDKTTNTHFETTFEQALLHKGLTAKKAFSVKADTRDRPKDFAGNWIAQYGRENNISGYVKAFLQANHLKVA
jgi:hypothetical protein